ncbi:recombinase family protein [Paenibacillus thermotolerans]|uniref:recombinase family protein n=1 Tax=Paenibacillus thermotolerans TaxID=3027807 RepID=UPI0023683A8D|nr:MULTISPECIES: recombinase family protein [unclassified Paenibacillus]
MKYGYARVSTKGQDLTAQIKALRAEGCEVIFQEKFTGQRQKDFQRPELNKLLQTLKTGDSLVVTKLDRFARSASDATSIIEDLFDKGIRVHVLNIGIIENTATGNLIFNIFMAFAQFERDMIIERTQEGKAIAKLSPDFREGRPKKFTRKQIEHALSLLERHSYTQVEAMTGISKSTLIRSKAKSRQA